MKIGSLSCEFNLNDYEKIWGVLNEFSISFGLRNSKSSKEVCFNRVFKVVRRQVVEENGNLKKIQGEIRGIIGGLIQKVSFDKGSE
jgi:hypothetical protein